MEALIPVIVGVALTIACGVGGWAIKIIHGRIERNRDKVEALEDKVDAKTDEIDNRLKDVEKEQAVSSEKVAAAFEKLSTAIDHAVERIDSSQEQVELAISTRAKERQERNDDIVELDKKLDKVIDGLSRLDGSQ